MKLFAFQKLIKQGQLPPTIPTHVGMSMTDIRHSIALLRATDADGNALSIKGHHSRHHSGTL
jgi:hypothetical protein